MFCPFCCSKDTRVVDSREIVDGTQIRRRRECPNCAERFTTYEKIELSLPRIIKKDGSFTQFREDKLRSGIMRAIEKRTVKIEEVDRIVNKILHKIRVCGDREILSNVLGEWVMDELKDLDQVAYVRFASVYRQFTDVEAFKQEIKKLEDKVLECGHEN